MQRFSLLTGFLLLLFPSWVFSQGITHDINAFHAISSHELLEYTSELSSHKYGGRLSGSPGYEASARWVAGKMKEWGLSPAVGDSSYYHWFPNAWTEILNPGKVTLLPSGTGGNEKRKLIFPEDYYPGSNSASGNVTGEVIYAGFGITAPGLGYDDYAGLDVKGKIVMLEPGVPYEKNDSILAKWELYSYHRYKFQRAREMGAAGLLYTGLVANPNTSWIEGFIYAHISEEAANDLLRGTGKKYGDLKGTIVKTMQPLSFPLKRRVSIAASTRHFPDSRSCNVAAMIEGNDPVLKNEAIIVGAHLDAVGSPGTLFPGALDNASGCADLLGAARALATSSVKPARSVIFIFFGGEECGLYGSRHCIDDPLWPQEKVAFMINLDMVGNGTGFLLAGGNSFPEILRHFTAGSDSFIHRTINTAPSRKSYGRPRTDGAVFEKAGYKVLSLWTTGTVKTVYYHQPLDNSDALTPEIMEDAAKLLYLGILGAANDKSL